MAITFVSAASAEANTVSMPSHQAGDLIVLLAMRSTNSAITVPSGWFSEVIASGSGYVAMAWKTAASDTETTGTWTSAESIAIVIYRSNVSKYVLAGGRLTTTQNTASIQYFAFSIANVAYRLGPGTSRYVGFCWTNGAGAAATPPTGMVNRTNAGSTYRIAAHDTDSEIASWAFQSLATTSMVWRTLTWEIFESDISVGGYVGPQVTLPATPLAAIGRLEINSVVDISGNDLEVELKKHASIAITPITPANSAVAGWFKFPEDLSLSINTLLFCGTFRSTFATNDSLWVYVNDMAAATTLTYRCNGITRSGAITSTNFINNWHHVVANNEAGAITVYLNGVSQGSWSTIANPDIRAIGIDSEGSSGRSNADGAGVAVWDRILTGEEITWLANPANRPGPLSPTPSEIATAVWARAGRTLTS